MKMRNSKFLLCCFFAFCLFPFTLAEAASLVESTLKDSMGIRPLGMGGAFVALANDANALYYNPAGLADRGFSYTQGEVDLKHTENKLYDGSVLTLGSFGFGEQRKIALNGKKIEVSSVGYGNNDGSGLSWGATYKRVRGDLSTGTTEGWSADFGVLLRPAPNMSIGLAFYDLAEDRVNVPVSVRAGVAYMLSPEMVLATDVELRDLKSAQGMTILMHYGIERKVAKGLAIRAGWEKGRYSAGLTAGFPFVTIDYALSTTFGPGEAIQMFGVRVGGF